MIISHHPPCYYECTFRIGSIRVCTRCFGVLLGALIIILQKNLFIFTSTIPIWVTILLPLPAVIDFTSYRLELWGSNNIKRFFSGLLLGILVGIALCNLFYCHIFLGIIQIIWLVILELLVIIILKRAGKLEEYIKQYEIGVRK